MNLQEKLESFKEKGWTYNPISGEVFSHTGKLIKGRTNGCIGCALCINNIIYNIKAHQLAYYLETGEIPDIIDHLDGDRCNNIFTNLSNGTLSENQHNRRNTKGYYLDKNKWRARIVVNKKHIQLGRFEKEEDAREAYLKAKEIYHPTKAYLFK